MRNRLILKGDDVLCSVRVSGGRVYITPSGDGMCEAVCMCNGALIRLGTVRGTAIEARLPAEPQAFGLVRGGRLIARVCDEGMGAALDRAVEAEFAPKRMAEPMPPAPAAMAEAPAMDDQQFEASVDDTVAGEAPAAADDQQFEAAADDTVTDEAPAAMDDQQFEASVDDTVSDEAPAAENDQQFEASVDDTVSDEAPAAENDQQFEASADDTPPDDTPSDDTPSDDTPSDDTPSDDTPPDDTPEMGEPERARGFEGRDDFWVQPIRREREARPQQMSWRKGLYPSDIQRRRENRPTPAHDRTHAPARPRDDMADDRMPCVRLKPPSAEVDRYGEEYWNGLANCNMDPDGPRAQTAQPRADRTPQTEARTRKPGPSPRRATPDVIDMCASVGEERAVFPFDGVLGEYSWVRVDREDGHYLRGKKHGSCAVAVPGIYAQNPPSNLSGFDSFAFADDGTGYWIRIVNEE